MRSAWLVRLPLLLAAAPLRAQCPDGTPQPCARAAARAASPNSVAVLYFDNLSRDSSDAYLADGLTEDIIVRLGQVRRLDVKSRYASRRFKGRAAQDPGAIGRALGAGYLLGGTVRPAGGRLRVTAELVRAANGARVWGEVFDRSSSELLVVPEEIARAVAAAITGGLGPEDRAVLARRPTADPVAYELYLRGNFLADRFTEPDLRAAIALYEQALARDSTFALAYRGLAYAWSFLADDFLAPRDAYPQALRAVQRALAIDSSAAALAWTLPALVLEYDVETAERSARRALELDPDLPDASWGMMWVRRAQGRMQEAADYSRRGWERDTLSFAGARLHVLSLDGARRYDELTALVPHLRSAAPGPEVRGWEGVARLGRGDCEGAVALLRAGHEVFTRRYVVPALVCAGRRAEARAELDSLLLERRSRYLPGSIVAAAFAALGDLDRAFEWMNRACDERDAALLWLRGGPMFDPLRADPRFDALLRRTWLAPRPAR